MGHKVKLFLLIVLFLTAVASYFLMLNLFLTKPSGQTPDFYSPTVVTRQQLTKRLTFDTSVHKDTDIFFIPNKIKLDKLDSVSVDIVANTHANKISAVQLELLFDPKTISSVVINKPQDAFLFGQSSEFVVLFQEVDKKNGKIVYAVGIKPGGTPRQGVGNVLNLTVTPNPVAQGRTILAFSTNTMAVELGKNKSVVKNLTPLFLTL